MKQEARQQSGMTAKEAATLLSEGKHDDMMDTIYTRYTEYRKAHDLVIIEGLSGEEPGLGNVNDINAKIAATLETPVLLIMDSQTKHGYSSANDLANTVVCAPRQLHNTLSAAAAVPHACNECAMNNRHRGHRAKQAGSDVLNLAFLYTQEMCVSATAALAALQDSATQCCAVLCIKLGTKHASQSARQTLTD